MNRIESWRDIHTDLGIFRIALDTTGALRSGWHHVGDRPEGGTIDSGLLEDVALWIQAFTRGTRRTRPDFRIPQGPPFYRRCWETCRSLADGEIISYRELARRAGRAGAARAAGAAMRHNPTPLLVPCHRIVRENGRLGGFAGRTGDHDPALVLKRRLLELEDCEPSTGNRRGILFGSQASSAH